ncbi:MAG TPA: ArsA-related P-loop ATPase [Egibacteraceae bacterium]|nr:ArsA-related P-loop ATPase [Egibacteraceae bacterium]
MSARDGLTSAIAERGVIVCTGAGGVGKTTVAAGIGLLAAAQGRRTAVLTIDPAQRLAQAMGMDSLTGEARSVEGIEGLDAMMLDMRRTFDEVIDRHAPDQRRAEEIKANRFYRQLSDSLSGTQEYMAMEKLHELHTAGHYDCIVIDTPPTRSALDFLDAPRRMTDFMEGRFLKMFVGPGVAAGRLATRAVGFGTGLVMRAASRITGAAVLHDIGEFFQAFDGMYEGFKERAQSVHALLQSPESAFAVIASPDPPALREARFFVERLAEERMRTAAIVVNRMTPAAGPSQRIDVAAAVAVAAQLETGGPEGRAAAGLLRLHADRTQTARRERAAVDRALGDLDPELIQVPLLPGGATDLDGLRSVAAALAAGDAW